MLRRLLWLSLVSLCWVFADPAAAQAPAVQTPTAPNPDLATQTTTVPQPVPEAPRDPFGRSNPRSMLREFISVLDRNDYVSAARYMNLSKDQQPDRDFLASDLRELLNCCFDQPLTAISDADTGALDDGLPEDQERVGPLKIGNHRTDIILVRVNRPEGKVWLVSSVTLEEVPALRGLITESRIQRLMPQTLQKHILFGLSLAQWIVWVGSFVIPLLCLAALAKLVIFLIGKVVSNDEKRTFLLTLCDSIEWPVILILAILIHILSLPALGFPLRFRIVNRHTAAIFLIILLTVILRRLISIFFDRTRAKLLRSDRTHPASLLLLGERLLKVLIIIAAGFAILTAAGIDTKTALTGLGIGGIAVAFGAQKTIENLLGGILLISDKAIAIGDFCSISDRMGTIEDITLRSVRMRTLEQTLLSIPAGMLSQANIENFRTRTKFLMSFTVRLQYSATAAQISTVRDGIYGLLTNDARVEGSTARVSLTDFGQYAIELQIWAYLLTPNVLNFHAIRQEILLRIAQVVESAGCRFALPSQTIYTRSDVLQSGGQTPLPK